MTEQLSAKLKTEAEIGATQLIASILKTMMDWIPLIRQYKLGGADEKTIKLTMAKAMMEKKVEVQQRLEMVGASAENQLKDLSELSSTDEFKKIADTELAELQDKYFQIIGAVYESMNRIAEKYTQLEIEIIKPVIEKLKKETLQ